MKSNKINVTALIGLMTFLVYMMSLPANERKSGDYTSLICIAANLFRDTGTEGGHDIPCDVFRPRRTLEEN